jgi:protein-S-isoprenylcysteine O-methyltransferase Ste14
MEICALRAGRTCPTPVQDDPGRCDRGAAKPRNAMQDLPLAVLAATISAYWIGVGAMIVRVSRRQRKAVGIVPEQRLERLLWLAWVPMVAVWIGVPWATLARSGRVPALPGFAVGEPAYAALRWIAAIVGVLALAATIRCWRRMGKDWRMDVGLERKTDLITDGMFARIRHPIYAFSILLVLCSAVIVPTAPMLAVAAVNIVLLNIKARNEERHLLDVHGDGYAQYLRRTGRFLPHRPAPM